MRPLFPFALPPQHPASGTHSTLTLHISNPHQFVMSLKNLNQVPNVPLFVAEDDSLGEGYMKTDLKSVQYGRFTQQDACLLVLESTFHPWNSQGSLWRYLKVVI